MRTPRTPVLWHVALSILVLFALAGCVGRVPSNQAAAANTPPAEQDSDPQPAISPPHPTPKGAPIVLPTEQFIQRTYAVVSAEDDGQVELGPDAASATYTHEGTNFKMLPQTFPPVGLHLAIADLDPARTGQQNSRFILRLQVDEIGPGIFRGRIPSAAVATVRGAKKLQVLSCNERMPVDLESTPPFVPLHDTLAEIPRTEIRKPVLVALEFPNGVQSTLARYIGIPLDQIKQVETKPVQPSPRRPPAKRRTNVT